MMEEYRIFLERIDKIIDRRQNVTGIYLTVNTIILASISLIITDSLTIANGSIITNSLDLSWQRNIAVLLLMFAGVVACDLWRRLILQYSTLLGWWFQKLREFETDILESKRLLSQEYEEIYLKKKGRVKIGLTRYETNLTWLFMFIYIFSITFLILLNFIV